MNQDLFFDAMEYIDEDMIEAVDALRTRKQPGVNRTWIRWASAAACVCIAAGGILTANRYGWFSSFDSVEMEDAENQEVADGQGYIHSFVRVTVEAGEQDIPDITDIQDVTAVYDILQIAMRDEGSPQYPEVENAYDQEAPEGEDIKSESISGSGSTVPQNMIITFITADNEETIYFLEGGVLTEQHSDKRVMLSEQQIKELCEILNVK